MLHRVKHSATTLEIAAAWMRWTRATVAVLDGQLVPAMRWIAAA
jgi:hypothetical protein